MQLKSFFYLLFLLCNPVMAGCLELSDARYEISQPKLQLTTSIIDQQYCKGKSGSYDSLKIKLKLSFKNIGKDNLILYKGSLLISSQMISANLEGALAARYMIDMSFTTISSGLPTIKDENLISKNIVLIQPDSSYETNAITDVIIFLNKDKNENQVLNGTLSAGKYYLQVNISSWHWSKALAESFNVKWKDKGNLWSENVVSSPMLFIIEKNPKLSDCN